MHRGPARPHAARRARSPTRASSPGRGHASHGRTADAYMAHVVPHHRHIIRSYTRIRRLWVRAAWSVDCHQGAGKQHTGVSLCETLAGTLATYIIIIRMRAACRMPHAACAHGLGLEWKTLSPCFRHCSPLPSTEDAPQRVAKGECHVAEPCRRATSATDVSHLTKHSDVPKPRVKLPNAHAAHSCETRNEATRTRRVDAQKEPRAESSLNQ